MVLSHAVLTVDGIGIFGWKHLICIYDMLSTLKGFILQLRVCWILEYLFLCLGFKSKPKAHLGRAELL